MCDACKLQLKGLRKQTREKNRKLLEMIKIFINVLGMKEYMDNEASKDKNCLYILVGE